MLYEVITVKQHIEQGGFTGVRLADDGYRHTIFDGIAHTKAVDKACDDLPNVCGELHQLVSVCKLYVFLAEVELQFDERSEVKELFTQSGEFFAKVSAHLTLV